MLETKDPSNYSPYGSGMTAQHAVEALWRASALPETLKEYIKIITGTQPPQYADADNDALLSGVESRTSSPVRIERDENFVCASCDWIYPCGEGAGYAGGITSAAMDGMKVAEAIIQKYKS